MALGSLWSGGAIAASVAVKAGTQIPLVGIAQSDSGAGSLAAAGGAAGAAATAAGVAGTFVLGPLAALGAGYLGWGTSIARPARSRATCGSRWPRCGPTWRR